MKSLGTENPQPGKLMFVDRNDERNAGPLGIGNQVGKQVIMGSLAALKLQNPKIPKGIVKVGNAGMATKKDEEGVKLAFALTTICRPGFVIGQAKLGADPKTGVTANLA